MFRSKFLRRLRHGVSQEPVAAAVAASLTPPETDVAPALPEVVEDDSEAAWEQWLAAHDTPDFAQTQRMELTK